MGLAKVSCYTGIHDPGVNLTWYEFWTRKLHVLQTRGAEVFSRPLRYTTGLDGRLEAREKGIDVRLALDVVRYAVEQAYDVALIFSQDQDLSEAADEVRRIAQLQERWVRVASAFPLGSSSQNRRGIDRTDWVPFGKELYDSCLDPFDYRYPLADQPEV